MIQTELARPTFTERVAGRDYQVVLRNSSRTAEMILIVRALTGQEAAKKAVNCIIGAKFDHTFVNSVKVIEPKE